MEKEEMLRTLEVNLKDKMLTYDELIELLEDEKIREFFKKIVGKRNKISIEEIVNLSKVDLVNELYRTYIDITGIIVVDNNLEEGEDDYYEDSVKQWLAFISRYPLLTHEEEIATCKIFDKHMAELRKQSEDGEISNENGLKIYLNPEENRAFDKLVNSNYRLAFSIAKKYIGRGLDLEDLIQEANMGLLKACEKYDVNTGYRFSTYATWWIRQSITRGLANSSRLIRLPVHSVEVLNKIKEIMNVFYSTVHRAPSSRELTCLYLKLDINNLSDEELAKVKYYEKVIDKLILVSQEMASVNAPVGEDKDTTLADFVIDNEAKTTEEMVVDSQTRMIFERIFSGIDIPKNPKYRLTEREILVLKLRFGFEDGISRTLEEVGKELGVTRERIRQIQAKALRKLRFYASIDAFKSDYVRKEKKPYRLSV